MSHSGRRFTDMVEDLRPHVAHPDLIHVGIAEKETGLRGVPVLLDDTQFAADVAMKAWRPTAGTSRSSKEPKAEAASETIVAEDNATTKLSQSSSRSPRISSPNDQDAVGSRCFPPPISPTLASRIIRSTG